MRTGSHSFYPAVIEGAYDAERAAALSGVPKSTVYYWARNSVLVPSVSEEREKLWSYADLMQLRIIYWLRKRKAVGADDVRATSMNQVKQVIRRFEGEGQSLWALDADQVPRSRVLVDLNGKVYLDRVEGAVDLRGQGVLEPGFLDLLAPFSSEDARGPDLRAPRPLLRIIPGKLAGEPHIVGSRISTVAVAGLVRNGYPFDVVRKLYPDASEGALRESIDLEQELTPWSVEAA